MKAYVSYHDPSADDESSQFPRKVTRVQYSYVPDHWKMGYNEASYRRDELNVADVYSVLWPEHHCRFEVEQAEEYGFAIFCNDHPDFIEPGAEAEAEAFSTETPQRP